MIHYDDFISCNGYKVAKEKGLIRQEGKDYVVQDGDIIEFYLMYKALISGALIGIANLIPGISGATIAVMTNQYKRIMNECDQIISGQFKAIDYRYLCAIIGSAVMGIVLFSRPLHYVMLHYEEVALWAISGLVWVQLKL